MLKIDHHFCPQDRLKVEKHSSINESRLGQSMGRVPRQEPESTRQWNREREEKTGIMQQYRDR